MDTVSSNRLLRSLSSKSSEQILRLSTEVELPVNTVLYSSREKPTCAYFLTSGIASIVAPLTDGRITEIELVGREGLVGSFHLLGPASVETSCFMQIGGTGLKIDLTALQGLFNDSTEIRSRILELVQHQALTISQLAACNRHHEAETRLARWLLMAQDRTEAEVLNLKQTFLAKILGIQRPTVSATAGTLQANGLISYRRGRITIVDRQALEGLACGCYRVTKELYTGLFAPETTTRLAETCIQTSTLGAHDV